MYNNGQYSSYGGRSRSRAPTDQRQQSYSSGSRHENSRNTPYASNVHPQQNYGGSAGASSYSGSYSSYGNVPSYANAGYQQPSYNNYYSGQRADHNTDHQQRSSYGATGYSGNYSRGNQQTKKRYGNESMGSKLNPINWNNIQLQPLKKNIYNESPVVFARQKQEVDNWLQSNQVTLKGHQVPRPIFEFNEVGFPQQIVDLLYKNYQHPTVIQSISWPVALSGRDMVSIAKTGSGKTLGFLLPGIVHTLNQENRQSRDGPYVLIMLPTRELAQQVYEVAQDYCKSMGLTFACCYGGVSKGPQIEILKNGVDICIGTPGRLLDFLQTGVVSMKRCSFLVLDEADRMLDMGFEPQIRKIVSQIRPDRQTLMFSATWPVSVRNLASDFHTDHVFLNVGSLELAANHNIEQIVEVVEEHAKKDRLMEILEMLLKKDLDHTKILVFVETKVKADDLTRELRTNGWPVMCLHGDKAQTERDWVMNEFKSNRVPILFATDVASRGLDVNDITAVINMDYPKNSEEYVHRIGRTGRCEKRGVAYTLFSPVSAPKVSDLIKVLEEASQNVPDELRNMSSGQKRPAGGKFSNGPNSIPFKQSRFANDYAGDFSNVPAPPPY